MNLNKLPGQSGDPWPPSWDRRESGQHQSFNRQGKRWL